MNAYHSARARGFTLVELMVALTVSLLILAGVAKIFLTTRSTFSLEEALSYTQEAGRFSMELIAQDVRMAGYAGCNSKLPAGSVNNTETSPAYQILSHGLRGYRYAGSGSNNLVDWEPDLPGDFFSDGEVRAGTDVIIVQHGSALDASLTGNMANNGASLQILNTAAIAGRLKSDDVLLIADCENIDVFRTNSISSASGKKTIGHVANLSKKYTTQAQLMKLVSRAYYIGTGQSGEPALMRKEVADGGISAPQELAEGIEDMRITYGEDTSTPSDGVPNLYRVGDQVGAWDKVMSVRIGLLARTNANIDAQLDSDTYSFDGVLIDPPDDHRRRQFFLSTIQLRN